MTHDATTPLAAQHEAYSRALRESARSERGDESITLHAEVEYIAWGPGSDDVDPPLVVGSFGLVEPEYAAIRRGAGLVDSPQSGVIRVSGRDRRAFLNSMLTQELKDLEPGMARRSFWLNRKGRIEADLLVVERESDTLLEVDRHQLQSTVSSLGSYIFTEDAQVEDATSELYIISIHGRLAGEVAGVEVARGAAASAQIAGVAVDIARADDPTGEPGLELFVPREKVADVWRELVGADHALGEGKRRVRPVGWFAFNIARIESGTPWFNIDFGPDNLPHESGVLRDRVSFTKGCYLGQEIVARMESLGKPKQRLVGLRVEGDDLPVAGAQVFAAEESGDPVGVVTSSSPSPMLGAAPVAFAMMKTAHSGEGKRLRVSAEGSLVEATVVPLRFWGRADDAERSQ